MPTSVGPEMKFFRRILSHLMLIIILSLLIYVYWNRSEIWSEETTVEKVSKQAVKPSLTKQSDTLRLTETPGIETKSIEIQDADVRASSEFSERMRQYRQSLPVKEREAMDKAASTFHQVSGGAIKYPAESESEVKPETQEIIEQPALIGNDVSEQISEASVSSRQQIIDSANEVIIVNEIETNDSLENEANEDFEVVISQSPALSAKNTTEASTEENSTEQNDSAAQTENLQKQIRSRQKQLQNQMLMLIPFSSENSAAEKKHDSKNLKPVINTVEQRE